MRLRGSCCRLLASAGVRDIGRYKEEITATRTVSGLDDWAVFRFQHRPFLCLTFFCACAI